MALHPVSRKSALGLLTAGAAAIPLRALGQNAPTLRAGVESGAETFAELQYGAEAGVFARAGLNVVPSSFPTAGPIAAALAGGALDVGTIDVILLANAVNRGVPLVAIAGSGLFRSKEPTSGLCVPASSPLRNAKQFEGQTIAVGTLSSLTSISLRMWLAQNGADPAKVQFVEMKFVEMPAALQRGTVASAYIPEPMITQNFAALKLIATPYSAIAETFPISLIITTRAWLAQNASTAPRFVAAVYDTARWTNKNRPQTAVMLAKYAQQDLDVITRMHRTEFATVLDAAGIQSVLDAASANKLIDRPTNATDLIARFG
jgi:NitT/TauT family transport system substrate-binding protein